AEPILINAVVKDRVSRRTLDQHAMFRIEGDDIAVSGFRSLRRSGPGQRAADHIVLGAAQNGDAASLVSQAARLLAADADQVISNVVFVRRGIQQNTVASAADNDISQLCS